MEGLHRAMAATLLLLLALPATLALPRKLAMTEAMAVSPSSELVRAVRVGEGEAVSGERDRVREGESLEAEEDSELLEAIRLVERASLEKLCGAHIPGWERRSDLAPVGRWEGVPAESASACAGACAAQREQCAGALWEEGALANGTGCQLIRELTGLEPRMQGTADVYIPCNDGCGALVWGYEMHGAVRPMGAREPSPAGSLPECVAACSAAPARCVAAFWEEDEAAGGDRLADTCHLVGALAGYAHATTGAISTLYVACVASSSSTEMGGTGSRGRGGQGELKEVNGTQLNGGS